MDSTTDDTDLSSCEGHKQTSFKCPMDDCKASFRKRKKLLFHIRLHVGERPYACNEEGCSKTYTNSSHLRRHKASVHATMPKVKCTHPGCDLDFYNSTNLKRHIARMHDENRKYRYTCEICNEGFCKKVFLQKHLYVHTGVKEFECTKCPSKFVSARDLKKHMRTHTTYTCDVCSETFERYLIMLRHKREIHKATNKCDECDKTFASKHSLRQHKKWVHVAVEETKVFVCPRDGCEQTYLYKRNLNVHIRQVHDKLTTEKKKKQFPCTVEGCDAILTRKQYLRSHLKIHEVRNVIRKRRKDAGIPKKSIVGSLTSINLTKEQNRELLHNSSDTKTTDADSESGDSAIERIEYADLDSGDESDIIDLEMDDDADSESEITVTKNENKKNAELQEIQM